MFIVQLLATFVSLYIAALFSKHLLAHCARNAYQLNEEMMCYFDSEPGIAIGGSPHRLHTCSLYKRLGYSYCTKRLLECYS